MKFFRVLTILCAFLLVAGPAMAVEPAYQGEEFGNNEEPALRPYKWIFNGVKSLVWHTKDQFVRGNMASPVTGTAMTLRGVRRGTVELLESTYRGAVFAIPPEKGYHKEIHTANTTIEQDPFLRNSANFLFSWSFFPSQKVTEHYPRVEHSRVDRQLEEAKEIREERREAYRKRQGPIVESRVKRAQRHYIGERAAYGADKAKEGRGDLTKLGQ